MGMLIQGFSEKSLKLAMKLSMTNLDVEERCSKVKVKNTSVDIKKRHKRTP